ncbi:D-alanyl-D-alanine carboxypeptidase family protein [Lachnospiraceae bacterium WCA-9-b2]|jgi:D-alanyl-D-alanine carboxypeptidase|uniref:D-alanyl-D-alanine carboxypeptidase family protein n=1 Tax=Sporofaciens musculi TaxID=2681861 RepID=A0A7X3MLC2_9FIRM|nr:M15 family metallopeptidase [Sporofaciens musculi]MXP78465.1 D-alanyl-D-alanine carboxypeptidase family protein [Sporofaciens musculi]
MTKRYAQYEGRRNIHRGRRHKSAGKMYIAGIITVILLSSITIFGFAFKTGMEGSHQDVDVQASDLQELNIGTPWYLTLVNKQNHIPKDYNPKLVKVQGGEQVDERIYGPLMEMLEAAKEANWNQLPRVVSGYRTADIQQSFYDEKTAKYIKEGYSESEAKEIAGQWVALPGYSEHQLGFAVDINGATYDVYSWLQENSYKYGFIFRYPGNKTQITGVAEEVWHYRYVGVEAATKMYEQGLCLEEYLSFL